MNKKLLNDLRACSAEEHHQHALEHRCNLGRRDFLKNLGLFSLGTLALSGMPVNKLLGAPALARFLSSSDRVLVLIRLKGGNDGINTIVPVFDYGTYASYRPLLKIPQSDLLPLDAMYSVPSFAPALKDLWDRGLMKVIHNVGYDNPDLSHFVSTDIIDSAQPNSTSRSGFLGRYLWEENSDFLTQPPAEPLAIHIGGDSNILFFNQDRINMAMNVVDAVQLYTIAQSGSLYPVQGNAVCYYEDQLDFIKSMINSTFTQSQAIYDAYNNGSNDVSTYPAGLGEVMALVARLIKGGLKTKIYMVTLDGFDTHAQQDTRHPELLAQLADSVKAFIDDLTATQDDGRVLCMTFSEFGRRVYDNLSYGTDHGTAAPWFVFGSALNGNGFIGQDVNLADLDFTGNLKYDIDFRDVYATILQDWLCADELTTDSILGGSFNRLPLGFQCAVSGTGVPNHQAFHQLRYHDGVPFLMVSIPDAAYIRLEVYDMFGRKVIATSTEFMPAGSHRYDIPAVEKLPAAAYAYRLYLNGRQESGKFQKY